MFQSTIRIPSRGCKNGSVPIRWPSRSATPQRYTTKTLLGVVCTPRIRMDGRIICTTTQCWKSNIYVATPISSSCDFSCYRPYSSYPGYGNAGGGSNRRGGGSGAGRGNAGTGGAGNNRRRGGNVGAGPSHGGRGGGRGSNHNDGNRMHPGAGLGVDPTRSPFQGPIRQDPTPAAERRGSMQQRPGGGSGSIWNPRRKENFDRAVLLPAARGKLLHKHNTGIPRLTARKPKAHLTPYHRQQREQLFDDDGVEIDSTATTFLLPPRGGRATQQGDPSAQMYGIGSGWKQSRRPVAGAAAVESSLDDEDEDNIDDGDDWEDSDYIGADTDKLKYYAPSLIDDSRYYWREEEYENLAVDGDIEEEDNNEVIEIEYGKDDVLLGDETADSERGDYFAYESGDEDDDEQEAEGSFLERGRDSTRGKDWERIDPEELYFQGQNDLLEIVRMGRFGDADYKPNKAVLPLRDHGPDIDDFIEAMIEHPSEYARLERRVLHPDSMREPKPLFPPNRANPPEDFVNKYARFLFVTGLPPLDVDGEKGDLANPIHRSHMQQMLGRLLGVDSTRVCPANESSAFVGVDSPKELAKLIAIDPNQKFVSRPPSIAKWKGSDEDHDGFAKDASDAVVILPNMPPGHTSESLAPAFVGSDEEHDGFAKDAPDAVVILRDMPPGHTSESLARSLFPENTKVRAAYGALSPKDIHVVSSTTALIRFQSKEQADSAVASTLVREHLSESFGRYPLRIWRARRELLHAGFGGPNKGHEIRTMGPRLIVDSDMPSKNFFLSHARLIQIHDLDPTLSKEEISAAFQPYCSWSRDIPGSIEWITCEAGLRTGMAYIGFDQVGEAEKVLRSLGGRIQLGDRLAKMRLVHDRSVPNRPMPKHETRREWSESELLDDLNNWGKYVDEADIKELNQAGISKEVLDDALRVIRFDNPTFGPLDTSLRGEALRPEHPRGNEYKELVQLYISTLKECIATPEDVGDAYRALHMPDQPIDLSIFEREQERIQKLMEKRANP